MIISRINRLNIESALEAAKEFIEQNINNPFYADSWLILSNYKSIFFNPCVFDAFATMRKGDDEVLGFIIGRPYDKSTYDIRNHYVKEKFRRRGIASIQKDYLVKYAKEQGYSSINSLVLKDNIASIKLNESAGWQGVPYDENTYRYTLKLK